MNRVTLLILGSAGAFNLGLLAGEWLRPEISARPAPDAVISSTVPPGGRMDQFITAASASARLRLMSDWQKLSLSEIEGLWADRKRLPEAWRETATRQLLQAWLAADATGVCAALIPQPVLGRVKVITPSNGDIEAAIDLDVRKLPPLISELSLEWAQKNPAHTGDLVAVLWAYTDDDDAGWDGGSAAKELARLMPERFLAAMEAHSLRDDSMDTAVEQIALTDLAKAFKLAEYYDLNQKSVLLGWSRQNPQAAIRAARERGSEDKWKNTELEILYDWTRRETGAALAFINAGMKDGSLPETVREDAVRGAAAALAIKDAETAWQWLENLPRAGDYSGKAREDIIAKIAIANPDRAASMLAATQEREGTAATWDVMIKAKLAETSPESVLQWCGTQPEIISDSLEDALLRCCADSDPRFVLGHTDNAELVSSAVLSLSDQPDAQLAAWKALPEDQRRQLTARISESMAKTGRPETAMELAAQAIQEGARFNPGWMNDLYATWSRGKSDLPSGRPLMDWLCTLPADKIQTNWFQGGFHIWMKDDSDGALAWYASHAAGQPSPVRNVLNTAVVNHLADSDPEKAGEWAAANIRDKAERTEALKEPFSQLWQQDQPLATAALSKAGFSAAEQQALFEKPEEK